MDYSIIVPVYNNAGSLQKTYNSLKCSVIDRHPEKTYEIIFIDDGSTDQSLDELLSIKAKYPSDVIIIKFTRNFGQVAAILSGYRQARGNCLINISADLQDPPELINQMLAHHLEEKYEIVICARDSRDESLFRRKSSRLFYSIMKKITFPEMPRGGFDYILISRRVKEIILQTTESNPFWQGQILWTGFKIKFLSYHRRKREFGKSHWTLRKKTKYLIDGILSYSFLPLRLMTISGITISLIGFLYALFILFARLFGNVPFKGWAPIMIIVLVLSGIQMLMLGIIGEYLWRTLDQVRNRPLYLIEKIYDS